MYRGTTPTIKWIVNNEDLRFEDIENIWMTFKDNAAHKKTVDISEINIDEEERSISYEFSQEETLNFHTGIIETQLRILLKSGQAFATPIKEFKMNRVLKGGVIE